MATEELKIPLRHHPRGLNQCYDEKIVKNLNIITNIKDSDMYIFDAIDSSFEYVCILNNIPYVFILDYLPKDKLTKNYNKYLEKLESVDGVLISTSVDEIKNYIYKIRNDNKIYENILKINKLLPNYINYSLQ